MCIRDSDITERRDDLFGVGFTLISKNEITINEVYRDFLNTLNCTYLTLDNEMIISNPWIADFLELGDVFVIRPDKYIYGCSGNDVSLEQIIEDLKIRME